MLVPLCLWREEGTEQGKTAMKTDQEENVDQKDERKFA